MKTRRIALCSALLAGSFSLPIAAWGEIISGSLTDWPEDAAHTIGDGNNHVSMGWSIAAMGRGYFGGGGIVEDSVIAVATGVSDISQIQDASIFTFGVSNGPFCDPTCSPTGVGEFIVFRNIVSGHYGVLRIDEVIELPPPGPILGIASVTWWFQTDGSGDFSGPVVPTPKCDVHLDSQSYQPGDTIVLENYGFSNPTSGALPVEMKFWLEVPGAAPISITNLGADGSLVLPAGSNFEFGPLTFTTVTAAFPNGIYEFNCRLLDPVTGENLAGDRNFFGKEDD